MHNVCENRDMEGLHQPGRDRIVPPLTKADALNYVEATLHQMRVMGRIDTEPDAVQGIVSDLESDVITPAEAMERARLLMETRQDYN